ncbi:hypothetical protein OHS71_01965 [Streptomyces sp. NBC_00377]|uniref:hypothetical protein n=1 Tax=unclassified Streptomyces TaxID=2593676 RepID=UPI002E233954|nr:MULTISPECIES: hypothetical protein [unclassified Streptomyces]
MTIIVMQELRKEASANVVVPGDALERVEAVHAAPGDPDIPGVADDRTFCGMPTADMERLSYQPSGPDASWLPPHMERWKCTGCAEALRSH